VAGHLGAHGQAVVFDDKDDGELEEGGEIQGFVVSALIYSAITEECEAYAAGFFVLQAKAAPAHEWNVRARQFRGRPCCDFGLEKNASSRPLPLELPVTRPKSSAIAGLGSIPRASECRDRDSR